MGEISVGMHLLIPPFPEERFRDTGPSPLHNCDATITMARCNDRNSLPTTCTMTLTTSRAKVAIIIIIALQALVAVRFLCVTEFKEGKSFTDAYIYIYTYVQPSSHALPEI